MCCIDMGDKRFLLLVTNLPRHFSWLGLLFLFVIFLASSTTIGYESNLRAVATSSGSFDELPGSPEISGMSEFEIEVISSGIEYPTGMAFLGPDDILALEQDKGTVQRVVQGQLLDTPILDVNVANEKDRFGLHEERGLLGIAVAEDDGNSQTPRYVFLYYTEAEEEDGGEPLGNRLYRYEILDNELVNPKMLLDLPVGSDNPAHNGGVIKLGPDGNVYVVIGNLLGPGLSEDVEHTLDQNIDDGDQVEGTGGILRVTQKGEVVGGSGILGEGHPLDKYFAYGIRNSFGMDFDPVTGNLWDTENGPSFGDEINLVSPGFNSGWAQILGGWYVNETINEESDDREVNKGQETSFLSPDQSSEPKNLITFDNHGFYSDPEFVWDRSVGPTSIIFMNSDKLGKDFENDIFVADVEGKIHSFNLVPNRTQLDLSGTLSDKIANNPEELGDSIASNFDIITDLEVGPDGYLYVL